ncbi:MAG: flagellar filament capping protein FliD [Betaproteobacteria bacterium]|nr:flagellar filament capping protein FliD [Betaproteobacteria bacterium]
MSVSLSGLVSGIDVQSLVTQLSAAYQRPITLLQNQEQSYQTTLSAWGTVQSALSTLQTAVSSLQAVTQVNNRTVTLSNSAAVSASVASDAPLASYSLSNIVLAQSENLYSQDFASAANSTVGTGTLQIQVGSGTATAVTIDNSNNTLNGIAAAINNAKAGVSAAVVYDGTGYRLTLTGSNTGAANAFTVGVSGATGSLASLAYSSGTGASGLTESQGASNAQVTINGLPITSASNTVSGAIPGVTLNLLQASGSSTLQVGNDSATFVTSVQAFASAYNTAMSALNAVSAYGGSASSGASGGSGPLIGNAAIQGLRTQLMNLISGQAQGTVSGSAYTSLGSVGLNLATDGTLQLDTNLLSSALSDNYQQVTGLFGQVGTPSNASVGFVSTTTDTQPGTYAVNIVSDATQASLTAASAVPSGGLSSAENLTISSGSTSVTVSLASGSTIDAIVATINATLSQKGLSAITALNNNGSLELQTSAYGSAEAFSVVSDQAATSGGTGIGTTRLSAAGTDVVGSVNGQIASGSGQTLTVTGPGAALGLKINVSGQATGSLGSVTVSQGVYQQMNAVLTQALNTTTGFVAAATSGLNNTISGINQQITQLQSSASAQTALLEQQFAAMQVQVAQLQSVGQYLSAFYNTSSGSSVG